MNDFLIRLNKMRQHDLLSVMSLGRHVFKEDLIRPIRRRSIFHFPDCSSISKKVSSLWYLALFAFTASYLCVSLATKIPLTEPSANSHGLSPIGITSFLVGIIYPCAKNVNTFQKFNSCRAINNSLILQGGNYRCGKLIARLIRRGV